MMRQNTGRPQIIIHVVTYPIEQLPSREFLEVRIDELQERLPLLHGGVAFERTNRPVYAPGYKFGGFQLVREFESTDSPLELYRAEMERLTEAINAPNDNRMWNVSRVTSGSKGYLILSLNHLITDGKGSTLLLQALTCPEADLPKAEEWTQPTRFDDTVSLSPSLRFLVPVVLRELMLPKMPLFVQSAFTKDDPWPGKVPTPIGKPWDIILYSIDPDLVHRLKDAGKKHGVKTLHPILKTAYLAAMWRVFTASKATRFSAATARSERKPELGHAAVTHNYVSSTEWDVTLSAEDDVWTRTSEFASKLASDAGLAEARMTMGLLRHVPDPIVDPTAPDYDPSRPTGWEKFFLERAESPVPFRCSLDVSNLGKVDLPPGAEDVFWGQTATPFGGALHVNVVGHGGGVRITNTWVEGSACTRRQVEEVLEVYGRMLERMAGGEVLSIAEVSA